MNNEPMLRTKGGVIRIEGQYHTVVDIWDNPDCIGEPTRVISEKTFATETEALRYYCSFVRPRMMALLQQLADEIGGTVDRRDILERYIARGDMP